MLKDKLDKKIQQAMVFLRNYSFMRISYIVMHPDTWHNLAMEVSNKKGQSISLRGSSIMYKEVKVLTSSDLPESEFEFVIK